MQWSGERGGGKDGGKGKGEWREERGERRVERVRREIEVEKGEEIEGEGGRVGRVLEEIGK